MDSSGTGRAPRPSEILLKCVAVAKMIAKERSLLRKDENMSVCSSDEIIPDSNTSKETDFNDGDCLAANYSGGDHQKAVLDVPTIGDVIPEFRHKLNLCDSNEGSHSSSGQVTKHNILQEPYGDMERLPFGTNEIPLTDTVFYGESDCKSFVADNETYGGSLYSIDYNVSEELSQEVRDTVEKDSFSLESSNGTASQLNDGLLVDLIDNQTQLGSTSLIPYPDLVNECSLGEPGLKEPVDTQLSDSSPNSVPKVTSNPKPPPRRYKSPYVVQRPCAIRFTKTFLLNCANEPLSWVFPEDLRKFAATGELPLKQMPAENSSTRTSDPTRTMEHIYFYEFLNASAWGTNRSSPYYIRRPRK